MVPGSLTAAALARISPSSAKVDHGARARLDALQHFQEAKILADVIDHESQHEAVEQRGQFLLIRQLVGRPEHRDERDVDALAAVVKNALIDDREQRIEDRGVSLEDFVQKGDVRFRQLVIGDAAIVVLLEAFEAHGAENLFGRSELGQQPLKIVGALDAAAEFVGEHRFGGSGRTDHQDMAGGQ